LLHNREVTANFSRLASEDDLAAGRAKAGSTH